MANEEVPWLTRRRTYAEAFQPPVPSLSNVVAETILPRAPSPFIIEDSETEDDFLGVDEDLERVYANAENIAPIEDEDEEEEDVQEKQDDIQTIIDVLKEEFQQGDESFERNFHEVTFFDRSEMNRANECFSVTIDTGGKNIHVDSLKFRRASSINCRKRGRDLLNCLKKAASQIGYGLIVDTDASSFDLTDSDGDIHYMDLTGYELLTKGQSYYNQQGFYQSDFPEHNLHNQLRREDPVQKVFNDLERKAWKEKAKNSNLAKRVSEEMRSRSSKNPFKIRDLGSMIKNYVKTEKVSAEDVLFISLVVAQAKPYFNYDKYNLVYNLHK